jgi:hypothetical protein
MQIVRIAQSACLPGAICPEPTTNGPSTLSGLITAVGANIVQIILLLGGTFAVLYIMYAGFQLISSNGNPDTAKKAKSAIVNAIIGVVVIMSAYFIINFAISVGNTVNGLDSVRK